MTWNDRLENFGNAQVYNFYSSGEEVLRTWTGGYPTSTLAAIITNQIQQAISGESGIYAWVSQEIMKGRMDPSLNNLFLSSDHGGWKFNSAYSSLTTSGAAALSNAQLQTNAFFDFSATNFTPDLVLESSTGSTYAHVYRNRILSDTIPAITLPLGANPAPSTSSVADNYDMQGLYETGWPAGFRSGAEADKWYHSDIRVVAYPYTHSVFDKFISLGGLK